MSLETLLLTKLLRTITGPDPDQLIENFTEKVQTQSSPQSNSDQVKPQDPGQSIQSQNDESDKSTNTAFNTYWTKSAFSIFAELKNIRPV